MIASHRRILDFYGGKFHKPWAICLFININLRIRASINVHAAAIWTIIEVFRDKDLLIRVRAELKKASLENIDLAANIDRLLSLPLLQSIHAEVLRLRVEVQAVFDNEREDLSINEWVFPKKSILLVPTGVAHKDANFWNTKDGEYPLNRFWSDRFLAYPNDLTSGPRRVNPVDIDKIKHNKPQNYHNLEGPRFISSGLSDSYMPFGVGERTCPGRFFARRAIVAFCAKVVNDFDIEILSTEKDFKISSAFYGLGVQRPLNQIPFRVRRRQSTKVEP